MSALTASAPPGWYPDSRPGWLRYWDGTAWTQHVAQLTPVPLPPEPRPLQRTHGLSVAVLAAIAVQLVVDLLLGLTVIGISASPPLLDYLESEAMSPPDTLDAADTLLLNSLTLTSQGLNLAMVVTGVLAMVWTWQVRVNAEALSPRPHTRSRGWAWAGWITPIVSFWFPYQVLRDVDAADKMVMDAHATTSPEAPIGTWWAFYLAYWTIGQVSGQLPAFTDPHILVYLTSSIAGIIAFILFRRVVHTIQRDQDRMKTELPTTWAPPIG